jgi:NTP pyrophosphatase (non-canonical NTP hydrolase)
MESKQPLSVSAYQKRATKTFKPHDNHKDEICDWLISLAEEVGEVQSLFKHDFYGGEPVNKEELAKEVGDVLWYLAALCTSNGIDMILL